MAYLDRDLPQLGLSKQVACRTPIFRASGGAARPQPPPSPFFLLEIDAWVVDGYSSALVRSLGSQSANAILAALRFCANQAYKHQKRV
jgi:hypothetical protein